MIEVGYVLGGVWIFALGATVGSFANVCIYRIPFEKSLIWPGSHCPRCLSAISARDNVPVLGWLLLRGRCRNCALPIPVRYPLIEFLAGALFVAVYLADLVYGGRDMLETQDFARLGYHLLLVSFLLVATFIDYDYQIIPDSITVTGMILGLGIGTLVPEARPAPGSAMTAWDGFLVGMVGLLVGGGIIWAIRIFGRIVFRREAMGFGDVTLMAMIGSFLGWQILPLTVFLASFLGLVEPAVKLVGFVWILLTKGKLRKLQSEIPFGPYLSMAAVTLMLGWSWLWKPYVADYYAQIGDGAEIVREWLFPPAPRRVALPPIRRADVPDARRNKGLSHGRTLQATPIGRVHPKPLDLSATRRRGDRAGADALVHRHEQHRGRGTVPIRFRPVGDDLRGGDPPGRGRRLDFDGAGPDDRADHEAVPPPFRSGGRFRSYRDSRGSAPERLCVEGQGRIPRLGLVRVIRFRHGPESANHPDVTRVGTEGHHDPW